MKLGFQIMAGWGRWSGPGFLHPHPGGRCEPVAPDALTSPWDALPPCPSSAHLWTGGTAPGGHLSWSEVPSCWDDWSLRGSAALANPRAGPRPQSKGLASDPRLSSEHRQRPPTQTASQASDSGFLFLLLQSGSRTATPGAQARPPCLC